MSTEGPIILWENYGSEGWQPRSFASIKEALDTHRFCSEYVITRRSDYEVTQAYLTLLAYAAPRARMSAKVGICCRCS
jgi:hypothetical protein